MLRIWFNHWFRTAYSLIELMKNGYDEQVCIIGSHSAENSPIRLMCDEWYAEEYLDEKEYVDFCLDFCKAHNIDIFVPHRHMTAIAANSSRFESIGVKLFSDSFDKLSLFENKAKAYNELSKLASVNIPCFKTVTNADDFKAAFKELSGEYPDLCVKFVKDEGAQSFRHIKPKTNAFDSLRKYPGLSITYDELYSALATVESFDELMVMPYMDSVEVSVDCLQTDNGIIALPRSKGAFHIEELLFDSDIITMAEKIVTYAELQYPCDIQFRYLNGKPQLLEVNARMSGGLPMSCAAADINIPALALSKLTGKGCPMPSYEHKNKLFSNVEIPIIIA